MSSSVPKVPATSWVATYLRLLGVQGAWNYETLLGNGIGFAVEPVLRRLPGGRDGAEYSRALARQSAYFNAHPYLASVAVGAVARAELDGVEPATIERFRQALCGPLGSLGDQLVWAAWLPFCSLLSLAVFGLGGSPLAVVLTFLITYNVGHFALRGWGLAIGFRRGLGIARDLSNPLIRRAPLYVARLATLLAGFAVPLTLHRVVGAELSLALYTAAAAFAGALLTGLIGRSQGWRLALGAMALFILFGVTR